ncbi:MAG: hypothetical protein HY040_13940 [Planctomycetes bacterium]|nr:hypothetical protein [Planctomycetota bacterium]
MALTIPEIVRQFKADVAKAISAETISKICGYLGYVWRERVLDPVSTVHVFLLQILCGNIACSAMPRLAGLPFSGAAYCRARMRLSLRLFEDLLQHVCDAFYPDIEQTGRWHGHRTWSLDGSSFSMSDTKALRKHFGQPSAQAQGCGFPVAHMLALFHSGTGLLMRVLASPMRPRRCGRMTCVTPPPCIRNCKQATSSLPIAAWPRSRIWPCFFCGKCTPSSAAIRNRSSVSGSAASTLGNANPRKACRVRAMCGGWDDGNALRWLRDTKPGTRLGPLVVNPYRPDRIEPRVLKRRMKEYNLMNEPRKRLRKALARKNVRLKSMPFRTIRHSCFLLIYPTPPC